MTLALLFPGQGSQSVGMGAALADAFASAREVYAEIDDALGQKLSQLMREGPEGPRLPSGRRKKVDGGRGPADAQDRPTPVVSFFVFFVMNQPRPP